MSFFANIRILCSVQRSTPSSLFRIAWHDGSRLFWFYVRKILPILLVSCFFLQLILGLLLLSNAVHQSFVSRTVLHVEVLDSADDTQVQLLYGELVSLPSVRDVDFLSREQAYALEQERDPGLVQALQQYGIANPFPASFEVQLSSLSAAPAFFSFVRDARWKGVIDASSLSSLGDQEEEVESALRISGIIRNTLLFIFLFGWFVASWWMLYLPPLSKAVPDASVRKMMGGSMLWSVFPSAVGLWLLLSLALALSAALLFVLALLLPSLLSLPSGLSSSLFAALLDALPLAFALELLLVAAIAMGLSVCLYYRR